MALPNMLTLAIAVALLSACTPEEDKTVAKHSINLQGNYPILTNANLDDLVSTYPLDAAIPELFKLENEERLERHLNKAQGLGLDREQLDLIIAATFEVVVALRLELIADITGSSNPRLEDTSTDEQPGPASLQKNNGDNDRVLPLSSGFWGFNLALPRSLEFDIRSTGIDLGQVIKGRAFGYALTQTYSIPGCDLGPASCDVEIDVDLRVSFPLRNPDFALSGKSQTFMLNGMNFKINTFKINNAHASINLSPNSDNQFVVSPSHEIFEDTDGNTLSLSMWTVARGTPVLTASNFTGVFTNTYMTDDGEEEEFNLTGSMDGSIEEMGFHVNYTDTLKTPEPGVVEFEVANNADELSTFDVGTMSGFLKGTNLKINLTTAK